MISLIFSGDAGMVNPCIDGLWCAEGVKWMKSEITYCLYILNASVRGQEREPGEVGKRGHPLSAKLHPVEIKRSYFLLGTFRNSQLSKIDCRTIQCL